MMEKGIKYHKRNMMICTVSVILLAILIPAILGFIMAYFRIVTEREQMLSISLRANAIIGIALLSILIWYGFTLEFIKRWWIIPAVIIVYFLSIFMGWLPWAILLGLFGIRYRKLINKYKNQ